MNNLNNDSELNNDFIQNVKKENAKLTRIANSNELFWRCGYESFSVVEL